MGSVIDKNALSYRTEQTLRQYAREAWRDHPDSYLGWIIDNTADLVRRFREWEHTCWHGRQEHMRLLWDVMTVWRVLNSLKHVSPGQYTEISNACREMFESLTPKDKEAQDE